MRRHSFTLLELLVSIGIILVLAAITFGGMNYASKRAQEAKTIATMEEFINALESFKQDYGFYPIIDKDEAKEVDLSADGWKLFMNDKSGVKNKKNRALKYNEKEYMQRISQRAMQMAGNFMQELYVKAGIKDNRYLFF